MFVEAIVVVLAPGFADCAATRPEFRFVTDLDVLFDSSTVAERKMSLFIQSVVWAICESVSIDFAGVS